MVTTSSIYRRHSFKLLMILACVYSGTMQLIAGPPGVIERALGSGFESTWSWAILVSGVFAWAGVLTKNRYIGFALELGGMLGLAMMTVIYGLSVVIAAPSPMTSLAGPLALGFSVACWSRAWDIARAIHRATADPDEGITAREVREKFVELVEENVRAASDARADDNEVA